jgi:hypothetical protein
MHAQIFVRFTEEIRVARLAEGLPPTSDAAEVLARTYLRANLDLLPVTVYARTEAAFAYLVFWADARSLLLHVECRAATATLRDLVRRSERIADAFIALGQSHGARLHEAAIALYSEDVLIVEGRRHSIGDRLMNRFAETIFGDVVVGLFTCVLTGLVTRVWNAALVAGLASVLCFLAWVVIQIRGEPDAYEYDKL